MGNMGYILFEALRADGVVCANALQLVRSVADIVRTEDAFSLKDMEVSHAAAFFVSCSMQ